MSAPTPASIWSSSGYAPMAERLAPTARAVSDCVAELMPEGGHVVDIGAGHGHLTADLVARGFSVTAVEPSARMLAVGRARVPEAQWMESTGERTGLAEASVDCIASSFGSMFCDPGAGPAEWARILRAGGALVMSAWGTTGFLADMTDRMTAVMSPGATARPPHMLWGEEDIAAERLGPWFENVRIETREMPWHLDSVEAGMELYEHGSPTHAFALTAMGARRDELLKALRAHLEESTAPDGAIRSSAGYCLITARRRGA